MADFLDPASEAWQRGVKEARRQMAKIKPADPPVPTIFHGLAVSLFARPNLLDWPEDFREWMWSQATRWPTGQGQNPHHSVSRQTLGLETGSQPTKIGDLVDQAVEGLRTRAQAHTCHHPTCDTHVPPARFACPPHWRALPLGLRQAIWRNYVEGQEISMTPSRSYLAAARACLAWWQAHP